MNDVILNNYAEVCGAYELLVLDIEFYTPIHCMEVLYRLSPVEGLSPLLML